jgi:hypothetical protein
MASKGRDGDSMLVHMTPGEVHGLQALAMKHGGSLTVNPDTGLPEANFLKSILPILAGFALGPAGMGIAFGGLSSAASAGLLVGGVTGLATGSLSKGLMAGLGAYGGAGLGGGLSDLGAGELAQKGISESMPSLAEGATQAQIADYTKQVNDLRTAGLQSAKQLPLTDRLSAGFSSATASPTDALAFAKQNMMPLAAAASPIMADMMVPTTTKAASPMAPGRIREKRWNGQYFEDVASTDAGVYNTSGRNFSDLYRGYNDGGIVALADGGAIDQIRADAARLRAATASTTPTQAVAIPGVVDTTKPGQYVTDPATGNAVALSAYSPGFDPNNKIAQTYLGELAAGGGKDTTSQMFNQMGASQGQKDTNATAYAAELARLQEIDRQNALKAPTGLANLNQNQNLLTNQNQNLNAGLTAIPADASYTNRFFAERGLGFSPIDKAIDNFFAEYTDDLALMSPQAQEETMRNALKTERMNEADVVKATGKTIAQHIQQKTGNIDTVLSSALPGGVSGAGITELNPNGTITTSPDLTLPMRDVRDAYTQGGGSLGYTSPSFDKIEDFNKKYVDDRMSGDSLAAYNYLSGKKGATYPTKSGVGRIAVPYDEAVLGYPARGNLPFTYDKATGKMVRNMDYVAPGRDDKGNVTYTMSLNEIKKLLTDSPLSGQALYDWAQTNKVSAQQIADATGRSLSSVYADFRAGSKAKTDADKKKTDDDAATAAANSQLDSSSTGGEAAGGLQQAYAMGGMPSYALGGLGNLGGYSDGGRLLKGPGDGVSDSIPATIGRKQQPARLADGEFVVPARIVSELGNGSTDAGAKKLYAMMDRVQRARGKTTGKNKVAANSRADKYLPA